MINLLLCSTYYKCVFDEGRIEARIHDSQAFYFIFVSIFIGVIVYLWMFIWQSLILLQTGRRLEYSSRGSIRETPRIQRLRHCTISL